MSLAQMAAASNTGFYQCWESPVGPRSKSPKMESCVETLESFNAENFWSFNYFAW